MVSERLKWFYHLRWWEGGLIIRARAHLAHLEQLKVDRRYGTSFYYLIFFSRFFFTLCLSGLQHAAAICTAVNTMTLLTLTYSDAFTFTLNTRYTAYVTLKITFMLKIWAAVPLRGIPPVVLISTKSLEWREKFGQRFP
jgi:hypothetical protein